MLVHGKAERQQQFVRSRRFADPSAGQGEQAGEEDGDGYADGGE